MCTIIALAKGFVKFTHPFFSCAYYKNYKIDLLTGKRTSYSLSRLEQRLDQIKLKDFFDRPVVFHLFYELGCFFTEDEGKIDDDELLAIEINYQKHERCNFVEKGKDRLKNIHYPSFDIYKKKYKEGYEQLLKGNCYQFNLTFPFRFTFNGYTPHDFISNLFCDRKKTGAYAHCTYLPDWNRLFLSNSPECLFQKRQCDDRFYLYSMPVKGSIAVDSSNEHSQWKKLIYCQKNEAELFMITDLLSNDLSSIERPLAKVLGVKRPLKVPGILHQYSLVEVELSKDTGLGRIVRSLFPGGSVTGAPKRQAVKILGEMEEVKRGFYCGSTIILHRRQMAASINIRSAEIDFDKKTMSCHSGGGITLLSKVEEEYCEMEMKLKSFIDLF